MRNVRIRSNPLDPHFNIINILFTGYKRNSATVISIERFSKIGVAYLRTE